MTEAPASATDSRFDRLDIAVLGVLGALAGAAACALYSSADPRFWLAPAGNDVWFEADLPTVADRILHRWSDQSRNARHPLFPLFATIPAYLLRGAGCSDAAILGTLVTVWAVGWSMAVYLLLRGVTRRRVDAVVFTLVAHVTAAAMFWGPVPETYTLASISVMGAVALAVWDPYGRWREAWYVAGGAFSLAITTTNWLAGLAAIVTRHPYRRAIQIAANSLCVVVVLWAVQIRLVPGADFFLGNAIQKRFVLPHGAAGIPDALRATFFHSIVMPAIQVANEPKWGRFMSVQQAGLGSSGLLGAAATTVWGALLALGVWTMCTRASAATVPLALALAGQVLVYATYGEETFLYTLHIAPLLICVAALSTHTPWRRVALALAAVLTVLLAVNNWLSLSSARSFFESTR